MQKMPISSGKTRFHKFTLKNYLLLKNLFVTDLIFMFVAKF